MSPFSAPVKCRSSGFCVIVAAEESLAEADAWLEAAMTDWENNAEKRGVADDLLAFKEWVGRSRNFFPKRRMPQILEDKVLNGLHATDPRGRGNMPANH